MDWINASLIVSAAFAAAIVLGVTFGPLAAMLGLPLTLLALVRLAAIRAPESARDRLRRARMDAFRRR
jgi:hypothetical protein